MWTEPHPVGQRRVARSLLRRQVAVAPGSAQLAVVTWNILADCFTNSKQFPYASPNALDWSRRRELIVRELLDLQADVYCLQEVQQVAFDYILGRMQDEGDFDGVYFQKPGRRIDGCATIYRSDKLNMHSWTPLSIAQLLSKYFGPDASSKAAGQGRGGSGGGGSGGGSGSGSGGGGFGEAVALAWAESGVDIDHMIREGLAADGDLFWLKAARQSNVAILCELECVLSDHRILVANTHLHWDPRLPDVKAVQMFAVLLECERRMKRPAYPQLDAIFIGGDFNSMPLKDYSDQYDEVPAGEDLVSGVYELAISGRLGVEHMHHPATRQSLLPKEEIARIARASAPVVLLPDPERDPTPAEAMSKKMQQGNASLAKLAIMRLAARAENQEEGDEGEEGAAPPASPEICPWMHGLGLSSAYADVCGREPPATNVTRDFEGTLDYLFFGSDGALAAAALLLPPDDILRQSEGLPNEFIPSDHVSLKAEFVLPPVAARRRKSSRSDSLASGASPGFAARTSLGGARRSIGSLKEVESSSLPSAGAWRTESTASGDGETGGSTGTLGAPRTPQTTTGDDARSRGQQLGADAPEFVPTFSTPGFSSPPLPLPSSTPAERLKLSSVLSMQDANDNRTRRGAHPEDGSEKAPSRDLSPYSKGLEAYPDHHQVPRSGEGSPTTSWIGEMGVENDARVVFEMHGVQVSSVVLPPQVDGAGQEMLGGGEDMSSCSVVETTFNLQALARGSSGSTGESGSMKFGVDSHARERVPGAEQGRHARDARDAATLVDVGIRVTNATVTLQYPGIPPVHVELPAHIYPSASEMHFDRLSKTLTVKAPATAFRSPVYYVPCRAEAAVEESYD